MKFLFDENLPPVIARALHDLGQPVTSVYMLDIKGIKDAELLPVVAAHEACLVTCDRAMLETAGRVAQFRDLGLSAFFLPAVPASNLELTRLVFHCWPEMVRHAGRVTGPFFASIHPTGQAVREIRVGGRLR